ncbi:MAG: polysaccharide biosynthesis C-terminal domain-containing protein [Candidatus Firestonebacteria bacterium]
MFILQVKKNNDLAALAGNSIIFSLLATFLLLLVFALFYGYFEPFLRGVSKSAIILAVSILPFYFIYNFLQNLLLGMKKVTEYNILRLIEGFSLLLLLIIAFFLVRKSVPAAIVCWWLSIFIPAIISIILVRKASGIKFSFNKPLFQKSLSFGIRGYAANLTQFFNYRLDAFLVNLFMDVVNVGFYSVAVSLAEVLWFIPGSVATVLLPKSSASDEKENNRFTPLVLKATFIITLLFAAVLFIGGSFFIKLLYTEKFLPALSALLILIPGTLIFSIQTVLSSDLVGRGKPGINTVISFIGLVVTLALDFLLIPKFGISGAAWASVASYATTSIITFVVFLKISRLKISSLFTLSKEECGFYKKLAGGK